MRSIRRYANDPGKRAPEIHWCDETGVRIYESEGCGYAPAGMTPTIRLNAAKKSVSMISSVTNQGKLRFMVYRETMNAKLFVRFLERLIKDAGRREQDLKDSVNSCMHKIQKLPDRVRRKYHHPKIKYAA